MPQNRTPYPVRVDASLDASLSRGLWLIKWLLLIPHYVVLAFLWLGFVVLSVVAFFAILFTGRYPRSLFDFNVGVLRWTWRVHYYGYGALGTDRYPPFTLADVPDYPAHLDVPYPERLSRGLVLVKWWLLALPHYLILVLFVGGGAWLGTGPGSPDGVWDDQWAFGGLVALLVFIAGLVLLFRGRYPVPIYDFVLGMDRWAFRVAAYAGLMTDEYPPFRLDMGGADPGSVPVPQAPTPSGGTGAAAWPSRATAASDASASDQGAGGIGPVGAAPSTSSWSAGRVVAVVVGAVLLFFSTGLVSAGGGLLWADQTQRDGEYLWSPDADLSTDRYALTSEGFGFEGVGLDWVIDDVLGEGRIEVTALDPDDEVFVGIARTRDVDSYLDGVGHDVLGEVGPGWNTGEQGPRMTEQAGGPPEASPGEVDIWVAEATGAGTQTLDWRPAEGNWTVVIMRADGAAGLDVEARVAATVPGLTALAVGSLVVGALLAVLGAFLIALAVRRANRGASPGSVPAGRIPPPRTSSGGPQVSDPARVGGA